MPKKSKFIIINRKNAIFIYYDKPLIPIINLKLIILKSKTVYDKDSVYIEKRNILLL